MSASVQKCAFLIIDGLGDLPVAELGNQTPLDAAHTPVLNRLASCGQYGLVDPIGPGVIPNTHSGTSLLFGLQPGDLGLLKRGPVEAFGAGYVLNKGDIALRSNFATVEERNGELFVLDRRAGRISEGTIELAAQLREVNLGDGVSGSLMPTDQHRGVLLLSGPGLDEAITDTDPGDEPLPARLPLCQAWRPEAEFTAGKINFFIKQAHELLRDHPLNTSRVAAGLMPASGLVTRGAGAGFSIETVLDERGIRPAVVAGCNTVRGLAKMFNYHTVFDRRFTAAFDTDLHAKVSAVLATLETQDLVYLHIKAPDLFSHDLKPAAKSAFLARLDQALDSLASAGVMIALAADHTTDSNTGFHTADPIPAMVYNPLKKMNNGPVNFGESACRTGFFERQTGAQFLQGVIDMMSHN